MGDRQALEIAVETGLGKDPIDDVARDDLERQALPEKSEPTSNPEIENLASRMNTRKTLRTRKANLYAKVTWDSPDDPANPKNWTYRRKWTVTLVVGTYTFISLVSTSIVAPALSTIQIALDIHSALVLSLCLSIFLLAYAFGPFLVGPLSEVYGRVLILQLANLFYLVFNTACGFANNTAQLVAFRFLAGLGAR